MGRLSRLVLAGTAAGWLAAGSSAAVAFGPPVMDNVGHQSTPPVPYGGMTSVEKARGPNAWSVEEIHARRSELDRKTVVIRAKVVKISRQIMGRNWIHLRDGSGKPDEGTHNIVATSTDAPEVGDIVTATGTLAKDRDFGSGYRYKVIVEDAQVK